jgi:hypothetical protein
MPTDKCEILEQYFGSLNGLQCLKGFSDTLEFKKSKRPYVQVERASEDCPQDALGSRARRHGPPQAAARLLPLSRPDQHVYLEHRNRHHVSRCFLLLQLLWSYLRVTLLVFSQSVCESHYSFC